MRGLSSLVGVLIFSVLILLSGSAVYAGGHRYVEDFKSLEYYDPVNTECLWDSMGGFLGLWTDPPEQIGYCPTPGQARDVAIAGSYAYVADGPWGVQVMDISDPSQPEIIGDHGTAGTCRCIAVAGGHAYVADGSGGLYVLDISDPTDPTRAGRLPIATGEFLGIAVDGDYAFLTNYSGWYIDVVDISDPTNPTSAATFDFPYPCYMRGCALDGNSLFVCRYYLVNEDLVYSLLVMDITNPTNPQVIGTFDGLIDPPQNVFISGDEAHIAVLRKWVALNIQNLAAPHFMFSCFRSDKTYYDVVVEGDIAYIANQDTGIEVHDYTEGFYKYRGIPMASS
jgi:hypothetical protein